MTRRACYVYRCFTEGGDLLYVGMSTDPAARVWSHRYENPSMYRLLAHVSMVEYPTRALASVAERLAIATEHPRFNKQHRLLRPERAMADAVAVGLVVA